MRITAITLRRITSFITGKGTSMVLALFFVVFVTGVAGTFIYARDAHAAVNSTINFQARVLQANGAVVPDGSLSVEFKIYNAAAAGTNEWTESQSLTAKNGYITASLGSVTPFGASIDWSQEHWITMNINGDGEMGPSRMKMTAVPYSFRSGQADSLTNGSGAISASQLAQLAPGSVQGVSSPNAAIRINQTGAGNLLQLQGNGTDVLTVSKAGDIVATGGLTVGNSAATTAGTIRWTGTAFEGYNGTSWSSLGGGLVLSSGATANFVSGLANVGANLTGTAVETLVFTSATAVSNTAGVTGFTAPAAGSFRTCLVKNNANITAGTLNVRWRVNGASVGAGACTMNATTNRQSAASLDADIVTFNAGDTIGVAFDTVGLAPTTNDFTVYWSVEYNSSSSSLTMQKVYDSSPAPVSVVTTDNKDISYTLSNTTTDSNFLVNIASGSTSKFAVQDNGSDIFSVNTSGGVGISGNLAVSGTTTLSGNLLANGSATGTAGTTAAPARTNVTAVTLTAAGSFANNDIIFINNAGQDYYTRIVSGAGTVNLTVSPAVSYDAGATVTKYNVQNIGATSTDYTTQANRFFQGYFLGGIVVGAGSTTVSDGNINSTATLTLQQNGNDLVVGGALSVVGTIAGNGSGLTNIDGSQINSGSIADSSLSANVSLLNAAQSFTAEQTFTSGLILGNSSSATAGALRWTGTSFEGFDGSSWGSIGGNSAAPTSVAIIQAYDAAGGTDLNTSTPTALPWNMETKKDSGFTHSNVTNNTQIKLAQAGWYKISYQVSGANQSANRNNVFCQVRLNGTTYNTPSGSYSYARDTTNAYTTNASSIYIQTSVANEYYEVMCSQAGTAGAQLATANQSWTIAEMTAPISGGITNEFIQGGNLFGQNATLGTADSYSLSLVANGVTGLVLDTAGNTTISNNLIITGIASGDGSGLTMLNGSNISSGTVADARLSANVTLAGNTFNAANSLLQLDAGGKVSDSLLSTNITAQGNTFNGASQLVQLTAGGLLPALSGTNLTGLNGSNISSGIVADARLTTNVTLKGNTFNGASQLVLLDGTGALPALNGGALTNLSSANLTGALPALNGSALTNINGTNISSGTVADARLSSNVTLLGNTFNGVSQLVRLDGSGNLPALNGSALTTLNGTNISSGTVADARLSNNVSLLGTSQTYTAQKTFAANITLGTDTASPTAGLLILNDATASNGFTSVLGTSALTANRSINLPDEAGTVCLSNSNNCGYVRFGQASAQVDASTNTSLFINKTGATGNILTLQDGGTTVFSVLNNGALAIQTTATNAINVKNAGGTDFFNVDTSGGIVRIGSATADANATFLVLDSYTSAADPAGGVNGAMYYNSAANKSRCYEGGVWIDCTTLRLAGETTLGSANSTINVALNGNYEYLECRVDIVSRSTASIPYVRFNNDTGAAAYGWNAYGIVTTVTTDWQDASDSELQLTGNQTGTNIISADMKITNFANASKVIDWTSAGVEAVGTNSNRYSGVGGYYNTSSQITSMQIVASGGTFASGSHAWCQGKNIR